MKPTPRVFQNKIIYFYQRMDGVAVALLQIRVSLSFPRIQIPTSIYLFHRTSRADIGEVNRVNLDMS